MISWILFGQIIVLLLITYLLICTAHATITDKRREDAINRKKAGL